MYADKFEDEIIHFTPYRIHTKAFTIFLPTDDWVSVSKVKCAGEYWFKFFGKNPILKAFIDPARQYINVDGMYFTLRANTGKVLLWEGK